MSKLEQMLEQFTNDKHWNTENRDGSHRFDKEIAWIGQMVREYAAALDMPVDTVVEIMEEQRDYSWPNYYQPANFPPLDKDHVVGVFKTYDEFWTYAKAHWQGFKCPHCGTISWNPQECEHRAGKDGKCDWCSYGFFRSSPLVVILQSGLKAIPIFEPVPKEGGADGA